jgi:hypothetical protein
MRFIGIAIPLLFLSSVASQSIFSSVQCSAGAGEISHQKSIAPQQLLDGVPTGCQLLFNKGDYYFINGQNQKCYDTLKLFIEQCPLFYQSWGAFPDMTGVVVGLASDTSIWLRYRNWLESVLYLNTVDPEYFCQCVGALSSTFSQSSDTTAALRSKATNRALAVIKWLLDNTKCDTSGNQYTYQSGRREQRRQWLIDTNAYALDTTLPSMHDLGIDSLLNLHFTKGVNPTAYYADILLSFEVSANPLKRSTTLRFVADRSVYLRSEVYDELGRMVVGDGAGKVFEPGRHELPIDLTGRASGVYYLRVSLGDGETRTIKLVKKE